MYRDLVHQQLQSGVFDVLDTESGSLLLGDLADDLRELVLVDLISFARLGLLEDLSQSLACGVDVSLDDLKDSHEARRSSKSAHLVLCGHILPVLAVNRFELNVILWSRALSA